MIAPALHCAYCQQCSPSAHREDENSAHHRMILRFFTASCATVTDF